MFEYILLLAGILLIVVLAVVVLRGGIFQGANKDVKVQSCQAALARNSSCYNVDGIWTNASLAPYTANGLAALPGACQDSAVNASYLSLYANCNYLGCVLPAAYHCGPKPA